MKKFIATITIMAWLVLPLGATLPASASSIPNWDVAGDYKVTFNYLGSDYFHDMTLVQDSSGNLTGNGGNPAGGPHVYTWVLTSGLVSSDSIDFYADYTAPADAVTPTTTMHILGTIASDGSMSGTWTDNYQGGTRAGTWATTSGVANKLWTLVVGNDANERLITDTYSNFVVIDTNHSASTTGELTTFSYYASNLNPFRFVLVDSVGKVLWLSDLITPAATGVQVFSPAIPVSVNAGDNLGLYFSATGTIPFETAGNPADYTPDNSGMPAIGQILAFAGSDNRIYSFEAMGNQGLSGILSAEDFGVVNYDTGLGMIKGYTAGFGLTDATLDGATSVVVQLFSNTTLMQTNTAILPKFNADITGTQFSSPFDVSGTFDYATDGYWTNVREIQYGQSLPATRVVAAVTLANGKIVTAENTILVGDPTTIYPPVTPIESTPTDKDQCKDDGWKTFTAPTFKNQGRCISFVMRNSDSIRNILR